MERNEQLQAIWKLRYWIAGFAVLVGGFSFVLSGQQSDVYKARSTGQVIPGRSTDGEFVSEDEKLSLTNLFGELARVREVSDAARAAYEAAVEEAGSGLTGSATSVDITARNSSQLLDFTGSAPHPADAAAFANAYAEVFRRSIIDGQDADRSARVDELKFQIGVLTAEIDALPDDSAERSAKQSEVDATIDGLLSIRSRASDAMRIIQPALPPSGPAAPKPFRDGVLATIAAGLFAALAAYARSSLSDRYATGDEISRDLDLAMLAEIPRLEPDEPLSIEAFRKLRTQLAFLMQQTRHPVVLFTSANPGAGKSHTSRGVTRAFAEEGQRVILVDSDLRRPVQHEQFDLPRTPGLGDLMSNASLTLSQLRTEHGSPHLVKSPSGSYIELLPAGSPLSDPAGAMSSPHMGKLIEQLRTRYDLTVLDTAPVLPVVDTLGLSRFADAVVLVVDHRKDKRTDVRRAAQTLAAVDVPLIGFIHNNADVSSEGYGYYSADQSPKAN